MQHTRIALVLLAGLAAAPLQGCNRGDASPVTSADDTSTPVPVQFRLPRRADVRATYDATANIDTESDAPVVAKVGGDVVELLVDEGERVVAGQALAILDGERLRLEMLAARANLAKVQGEYDRYRDLHERGLVSKASYDNLKFDLEALRATYELKQLEFGYATLRAPIDGVVATREIRPGQNLAAGAVAFRVTDTDELMAELRIPQTELGRIAVGQDVSLRVDSLPGQEFPAAIIRISPTVDSGNGTFGATAWISNSAGELAPGMFARFSIAYDEHPSALVIPGDALIEEDEETAVFVVNGDTVERRVIRTGFASRDGIEVLDGLDDNDQVVVTGQASLKDGSRVLARLGNPANMTG